MKLNKKNIVKVYNALCDKYRALNSTDLNDLTDNELIIYITGQTLKMRPFEGAYDNALYWINEKGRDKAIKTFMKSKRHEDFTF